MAQDGLYLIDGNSLAYRAFFALPDTIATADGRPTNAIHGFAAMLTKVLVEHEPGGVIVAWDAGLSDRELLYAPYKAQRPPRPDLLSEQWPAFAPLVEAFGFTNVRVEGYEADDAIAALVRQAREHGIPVVVVTGDRDAFQLVGDGVRVMTTTKGVSETKLYDVADVVERWGVEPKLVPDLIGLKGDSSDNIPGVPGIGEKTAAALLQEFGSLEAVLESVEQVSGAKRQQNLREHAEDARLSKRLAMLNDSIDVGVDVRESLNREPDRARLREVMAEHELRQVLQRLEQALGDDGMPPQPETEPDGALEAEAEEGKPEDLAAGPAAIALVGERWAGCDGARVIAGDVPDLVALAGALRARPLIAHDAKSLGGGARAGLLAAAEPEGLEIEHDTQIAAHLLDPARRSLDLQELAAAQGIAVRGAEPEPEPEAQLALGAEQTEPSVDPAVTARLTWELAEHQRPRLAELGLERVLREVELPLIAVLAAMEREGVRVDAKRLAEIGAEVEAKAATLQAEIWELAGHEFTIGSPQQLAKVLFEELGLSRKRRGKTGYSTDARVLSAIRDEHEIVAKVESWRELTKLKNTYLDALPAAIDPATGRVHSTFNQTGAATGRISSFNPNLQNIPIRSDVGRPIRSAFVTARGKRLLSADYSQVELRVLAHVAGEQALAEIFRAGEDVHTATAAEVFGLAPEAVGVGERSRAKAVNFGIVYGLSPFGLSKQLGISHEEAALFIERYLGRFPAVQEFIRETIRQATEDGYVTTLMGRRRPIPELGSGQAQTRQLGERLAVNTVIQGTAADIIKLAMVRCHNALIEAGLETRLILQIHDELLFEGPAAEMDQTTELIRAEMIAAYALDPPLEVDIGVGVDWLSAK